MKKSIIKVYRGLKSLLPSLLEGEPGLAKDTREFFIGTSAGNLRVLTELDSAPAALDILPVGTVLAWDKHLSGTPVLSSLFEEANGQTISNIASPYNGKRIRNLNGKTLTGITVAALDDVLKTFTVSLNDIAAFSVGDTLSFTTASVPNAVVKSVNYGTGEISVGDISLWDSAGMFQNTGYSIAGADTVSVSGQPRFLKGQDSAGSSVNAFQEFQVGAKLNGNYYYGSAIFEDQAIPAFVQVNNAYVGYSSIQGAPGKLTSVSDGSHGTPRTGQKTEPDSQNIVWVIKYK